MCIRDRATFGPNQADFERLTELGYDGWLTEQLELAPTLHRPQLEAQAAAGQSFGSLARQDVWWGVAVTAPDQLRQRAAFAWSELFVVSDDDQQLFLNQIGVADYYDMLVEGAFGNFRALLESVARSPVMGIYLSMHRNEPADPETNMHPDENFARELLQLFSIGLVQLGSDGTVLEDSAGQPVATYDQLDVENLARAFTGWNFAGTTDWDNPVQSLEPMESWFEFHDQDAKEVLDGTLLPAAQSGEADLTQVLDAIVAHPNTGPFIARHLIQRLVSSNPTPSYVGRVAAVFADNGSGVRGDLTAVIRAVLLDEEVANGLEAAPSRFGKLREPLLRVTALWRAFDGVPPEGVYTLGQAEAFLGQAPLSAPTVFNFFRPDHVPPGQVQQAALVAPEMQLADEVRITLSTNLVRRLIYQGFEGAPGMPPDPVWMDFSDEIALAEDPEALIDHLDLLLMGGAMGPAMRALLVDYIGSVSMTFGDLPPGMQRVLEAVYMISISPEGTFQP